MKQFEYKIINIELDEHTPVEEKIVQVLNQYGLEGWLVCSMHAVPKKQINEKEIKALLSREVSKRNRKLSFKEASADPLLAGEIDKTITNQN